MYKADMHIVYNQTYRIPMLLKFDEVGQLGGKKSLKRLLKRLQQSRFRVHIQRNETRILKLWLYPHVIRKSQGMETACVGSGLLTDEWLNKW